MKKLTKKQEKEQLKLEAINKLNDLLKNTDTLYTLIRKVSSSGMSRSISVYAILDGQPCNLDYWIKTATGRTIDQKNGGLKVTGCGMDMGFHLVYTLGRALGSSENIKDSGYRFTQRWL